MRAGNEQRQRARLLFVLLLRPCRIPDHSLVVIFIERLTRLYSFDEIRLCTVNDPGLRVTPLIRVGRAVLLEESLQGLERHPLQLPEVGVLVKSRPSDSFRP